MMMMTQVHVEESSVVESITMLVVDDTEETREEHINKFNQLKNKQIQSIKELTKKMH